MTLADTHDTRRTSTSVSTSVGDPAEAARRFRRFVLFDLAVTAAAAVALAVGLFVITPEVAVPVLAATLVSVALLAWSLRLYRAGRIDVAVIAVCVTFWLQLVVAPLVFPSLFGGFAVLMVWPVLFAIPYVTRRTLLFVSVATAVCAVIAIALAVRAVVPVVSRVPLALAQIVFLCAAVLFLALSLTVVYAYSGRLGEVVEGLRRANDALHESERSLEATVARRTAQVRHSQQETAAARDEAIGLSHELAAVLDNLGEGLLVLNRDGLVERVNKRLENMFKRPAADLLHHSAAELLPELADIAASLPTTREVPLPDGRYGRAVASAITEGAEHSSRGTVVLIRDVTLEREVDQMKTNFISTVSHELRTPLTSILGFAKIIAKRLDDRIFPAIPEPDGATARAITQVRGNLDIIVTEGERLTALINDVLDLAKMEAGRVEWRDDEVDVNDLVRRTSAATAALFQEKSLPLQLELEPELPLVRGDRHRLEQVVVNLLSNACKFTTEGSVTVRTRRIDGQVVVAVSDTGPGIAARDREALFERFKQVGDTLTGKPQGTGLGLPICKEIIEHHGGRMEVVSEPGHGSTFSFTLPLPGTRDEAQSSAIAGATDTPVVDARLLLRDLRESLRASSAEGPPQILVVDDHPPVRQLLRQELESHGYLVHEARDGNEAVSLAKSLRPDLVTLDVMMPDINGFDVAALLRRDPATMQIPILVVSILHEEGRAQSVGVDRYLTKPVDTAQLLAHVEALLTQGGRHRRIVVADTDTTMLETLRTTLDRQGWEVTAVSEPAQAVQVVRATRPDVVLARAQLSDEQRLVEVMRSEHGTQHAVLVLFE